jgi:hypothetical protein
MNTDICVKVAPKNFTAVFPNFLYIKVRYLLKLSIGKFTLRRRQKNEGGKSSGGLILTGDERSIY